MELVKENGTGRTQHNGSTPWVQEVKKRMQSLYNFSFTDYFDYYVGFSG